MIIGFGFNGCQQLSADEEYQICAPKEVLHVTGMLQDVVISHHSILWKQSK